jgi:hypothetical protein
MPKKQMSFDLDNLINDHNPGDAIFYFKGNIDSDIINNVLDSVEFKLITINEHPRLRKKVYNVLVESLQNLYHHADHVPFGFKAGNQEKYGIILMDKNNEGYRITTCNFISNFRVGELESKIDRINKSSVDEIKELYKDVLNHQEVTDKGLGGLGLIDIARKTGNKLDYKFTKFDDAFSAFCLSALINEE